MIARIPGAAELVSWFGRFPRFHDAYVLDFKLHGDGCGHIRLHGWNMTDRVDEKGFFVLDKHFVADFLFEQALEVRLAKFLPGNAIVFDLRIDAAGDGFEIAIESSYGFEGFLKVGVLRVQFQPGRPDE